MIAIMRDGLGVGLAATQLGILRRLLVFQAGPRQPSRRRWSTRRSSGSPTSSSSPRRAASACRGSRWTSSARCTRRVSGLDVDGEPVRIEASGLEARVLQHEIDHLDGVLILDRAPRDQRKGALRALREGGSYSPPLEDEDEDDARASIASRAPTREDRLPRHLGVRRDGPAPAGRVAAPPAARRHPARPPQGPRAAGRSRRPPPRRRASSGSSCCRPRTSTTRRRWSGSARPGPRRSRSAPSAS